MDPEALVKIQILRGLGFDQAEIAARVDASQQTVSKYRAFIEATARELLPELRPRSR